MKKDKLYCLFCGGELVWDSSAMANENYTDYDEDDTACVEFFHCRKCGREYKITEPHQEERENEFKEYWLKKQ